MEKIAYLECLTGIAGDMCLGALVDAGVPLDYLATQLSRLGIADEYDFQAETVIRQGQRASKVHVNLCDPHGDGNRLTDSYQANNHHWCHRHLADIQTLISQAMLPERVTRWSLEIFQKLAIAEATVHGTTPEQVHFHEVGATDAIVDIVGTCLGLDWLGIDRLYCSPMPTGGGTVKAAHGTLPVPVPAVMQLWQQRQVPIYSNGINRELVTPTGAAIAVTLAESFGPPPAMNLQAMALGAGTLELPLPNLLRLWIGIAATEEFLETVITLETQLDDLNPQAIAYASEQLRQAGALDVFSQAVTMKKNRLGTLLTVICPEALVHRCETILFTQTSTLGIRRQRQNRSVLARRFEILDTPEGEVALKIGYRGNQILNVQPEYEDVKRIAQATQQPWQTVAQEVLRRYHQD